MCIVHVHVYIYSYMCAFVCSCESVLASSPVSPIVFSRALKTIGETGDEAKSVHCIIHVRVYVCMCHGCVCASVCVCTLYMYHILADLQIQK